jgi:hypothetical protein
VPIGIDFGKYHPLILVCSEIFTFAKGLDPTDTSAAIANENFMNSNASSVPDIIKEWPSKGNNAIKTASGGKMPTPILKIWRSLLM